MEETKEITLPFLETKQNALMGHMLTNEQFFTLCSTKVKPSWFLSVRNAKLYEFLLLFRAKFQRHPKIREFKEMAEFASLDLKEKTILQSQVDICLNAISQIRLHAIVPELTEWLHSVILMGALKDAEKLYNQKQISECHKRLTNAVREFNTTGFDKGDDVFFKDFKEFLRTAELGRKEALTTGLTMLDKAILKDSDRGGLQKEDTTIILAPVNRGKTSFLITIACANIKDGRDVFMMSFEGKPDDIRLKIMANMMDCTIGKIFELYKTKEGQKQIEDTMKIIDSHFVYRPFNKAGEMYVENVLPLIRLNQEDWMSKHGKGFDLFIGDAPFTLSCEAGKKGNLVKREKDRIVCDTFSQLAIEYKWHNLLSMQTNREGSKINRGISDNGNKLLTIEYASESWGPIEQAANILILNRSPEHERKKIMFINIGKSRGSELGSYIIVNTNYAHAMTHSNKLGSSTYTGTEINEQKINELLALQQHNQ